MDGKRLGFLCVVLIAYICIGAGLFMVAEHSEEKVRRRELHEFFEDFLGNFTCINRDNLSELISTLNNARLSGVREVEHTVDGSYMWDYASALCFCITLITTIGYGDSVPTTTLGKCICVGYALIGIPLCLIVLGGIGERLSKISTKIARFKIYKRHRNVNKAIMTLVLTIIGVGVMFLIPSVVLMFSEEWHFLEGLYYCFITLTTVGFGDYVPGVGTYPEVGWKRNSYKIAIYLWILMGLAYLALVINILVHAISRRAEQVRRKAVEKIDFRKFTKRKSRTDFTSSNGGARVNPALALDDDEDEEGNQYEDLCEKCRAIVMAMEGNVKLVRIKTKEENGDVTVVNSAL